MSLPAANAPLDLTVWYDYHCPYSHRAVEWLIGLGPERVRPRFRPFPLEQVNRDATAVLEASEKPEVVDRFRLAVYRARFDDKADISDVDLLVRLAGDAGADARGLAAALADQGALTTARAGLATAWADARAPWEIFGVPTLQPDGEPPFYLRLERLVAGGAEAVELLDRVMGLRREAPLVLELKLPELVD